MFLSPSLFGQNHSGLFLSYLSVSGTGRLNNQTEIPHVFFSGDTLLRQVKDFGLSFQTMIFLGALCCSSKHGLKSTVCLLDSFI